jgi:hypothetical protein
MDNTTRDRDAHNFPSLNFDDMFTFVGGLTPTLHTVAGSASRS